MYGDAETRQIVGLDTRSTPQSTVMLRAEARRSNTHDWEHAISPWFARLIGAR